jgi:hypothetical protein
MNRATMRRHGRRRAGRSTVNARESALESYSMFDIVVLDSGPLGAEGKAAQGELNVPANARQDGRSW